MIVRNKDQRSSDYLSNDLSLAYRPSHADATYDAKYGVRAVAGGGRSSARETIGRVAAGAVAKKILKEYSGVEILAYVSAVQDIRAEGVDDDTFTMEEVDSNIVRCPDPVVAERMIERIDEIRKTGNSVGGVVTVVARNVRSGLGSPGERLGGTNKLRERALFVPMTEIYPIPDLDCDMRPFNTAIGRSDITPVF